MLAGASDAYSCILCQPGTYSTCSGLVCFLEPASTDHPSRICDIFHIHLVAQQPRLLLNECRCDHDHQSSESIACTCRCQISSKPFQRQLEGGGLGHLNFSSLSFKQLRILKFHTVSLNPVWRLFMPRNWPSFCGFNRRNYIFRMSSLPGGGILDWIRLSLARRNAWVILMYSVHDLTWYDYTILGSVLCWSTLLAGSPQAGACSFCQSGTYSTGSGPGLLFDE